MTLYQISVFNLQIQRLHYLIYDDSVSEADICQQVDPRADWPVESSSGLFNIASVCLRVDPNQRPDMEEVSNTHKIINNNSSFHVGCHAVGTISTELLKLAHYVHWFIFITK